MKDVIIIGAGVIGAACAYELSKYNLDIAVLEKSNDAANGTSKANSAIIHAGYDPKPGSLMARLNVEGCAAMEALAEKLDIPYKKVGSHVLAFSESEKKTLEKIYAQGIANGVPGLKLLDRSAVLAMEPGLSERVMGSLWAPSAGIVSPWEMTLAFMEVAVRNGVRLVTEACVTAMRKERNGFVLETPQGEFRAKWVVNAAGVSAEDIEKMVGPAEVETVPCRGEYYLLDKCEGDRVHSVIFQCPNELGKGVLVAPTVHGNLIVGPNAENVAGPEVIGNTQAGLDFVREKAMLSVPALSFRDNIRNFAGVRANHKKDDFLIGESSTVPGLYNVAGIKSPGLSSAPAIGKMAAAYISDRLQAKKRSDFRDGRHVVRMHRLNAEEKNELIRKDPRYGRVICRCETVTEGEIVAAIHSPVPAVTVNAVKRRTGAGMGRCQGGFCGPRVQEILARELGRPIESILLDEPGSYILTGATKGGTKHAE